jgi:hypothetical protein
MKKSNFALRLQPSLMEEAKKVAKAEGVAVNQLINVAVAEKVSALRTEEYFAECAAKGDIKKALQVLKRAGRGKRRLREMSCPRSKPVEVAEAMTIAPRPPDIRVWRYTSFGKLVWMLQKKQLWLSRADLFGDKWEVTLHGPRMNTVMTKRPTQYTAEEVRRRAARIIHNLRTTTFVNCWTASEHESHALWRIR